MQNNNVLTSLMPDGTAILLFEEPNICPQCHTMHYLFVNRGRTVCASCGGDEREVRMALELENENKEDKSVQGGKLIEDEQ